MKRLTVAIFCVIILFAYAARPALAAPAEPSYARAVNKAAYIYESKDKNPLFAVPYTYCVQVLRSEGDWYFVRYAEDAGIYKAVEGYCKKENLSIESQTPAITYLHKPVTLNLPAGERLPFLPADTEITLDAAYYGAVEWAGEEYSYVLCHGTFIYVNEDFGDYELNEPTRTPDDEAENSGGGSGLNFASVAFIVIASISVIVILIIYFTAKKPRVDG